MLVSVVIPAFNEEKYLPKTLGSVYNQAHPGFEYEVIVVDSASTDKTCEIAQKFGVRVIKTKKKTPAFARQKGIEIAQGEIIVCLDADTLAPKDYLKTVVQEFTSHPEVVGLTGVIAAWDGHPLLNFLYQWTNEIFIKISALLGKPGLHGQSFAVRKSAFMKIGGFKTDVFSNEDMELGYRLSKIGHIKLLPKVVGISSVRRVKEPLWKSITRSLLSYLKLIWRLPFQGKEKEPFPAVR